MEVEKLKKDIWSAEQHESANIVLLIEEINSLKNKVNVHTSHSEWDSIRAREADLRILRIAYHARFGKPHKATFTICKGCNGTGGALHDICCKCEGSGTQRIDPKDK